MQAPSAAIASQAAVVLLTRLLPNWTCSWEAKAHGEI